MSRLSVLFGIAVLSSCGPCLAVTVLGVPIGEKLSAPPAACPARKDAAQQACWVGRTTVGKDGVRRGSLHLPASDGRPAWAANQSFLAAMTKEGAMEELKLPNVPARERPAVIRTISKQFGTPRSAGEQGPTAWARWAKDGVHIGLACEGERCLFTIRTDAAEAVARRQAEAR